MAQVVIGVVEQYGPAILKPFLKSLALTGYEGDVVFFVSKLPDETKMFLDDFGVRKIHFRIHQFKGLWFWKHATLFMNRTIPARWPLRDPIVSKLWHC